MFFLISERSGTRLWEIGGDIPEIGIICVGFVLPRRRVWIRMIYVSELAREVR